LEDVVVTVDPVSGFKRGSHCAWAIEMLPWNVETLRRYATYLLVVVCIALLVHEIMGAHGFMALRQEKREIDSLREQIRQLKDENAQLDKRIKELQSDPKAIERLAREGMGLARPRELIFTGVPQKDSPKEQTPNAPADKTAK
jgi:cell division protein FtsB